MVQEFSLHNKLHLILEEYIQYGISNLLYHNIDSKKFDAGYCSDLLIIVSNFNMRFGLIFCYKLYIVSFVKIYGE